MHVTLIPYHMPNHRGHDCLVSPRLSSGNLICNFIVILNLSRVDFLCFVLGIYELPSVIHRHISILLLFIASYGISTFFSVELAAVFIPQVLFHYLLDTYQCACFHSKLLIYPSLLTLF